MFHNGCRVEEKDFDAMRSIYGARVHMAKVNTLNAEDIKKKYADGSAKPFFKAYKGGTLVNMIKYADWEGNKGQVERWLARHAEDGDDGYRPEDGKV